MSPVKEKIDKFFAFKNIALIGASDRDHVNTCGNKVLRWLKGHYPEVVPVHPSAVKLEERPCVKKLSCLSDPGNTALCIVVKPSRGNTKTLLSEARDRNIPMIWLQPGAETASIRSFIEEKKWGDYVIYSTATTDEECKEGTSGSLLPTMFSIGQDAHTAPGCGSDEIPDIIKHGQLYFKSKVTTA